MSVSQVSQPADSPQSVNAGSIITGSGTCRRSRYLLMAVWWLMVCHFLHLPGNTGSTQQQGEHAVGVSNRLPSCTCRSWSRASTGSARRGRGRRHGQKVAVVRFVACMYVGAAVVMQSQFRARGSARLLRRDVAGPTWYQRLSTSSIDISRQLPSCVSFLAVCRRPWLPPQRGTRSLRGGRRLVGCRRYYGGH